MKEKRNWPWFAPFCAALLAFIVASCAPSLSAPPHLVATWPVAGASLSVARHTLELTFNRPLQADASWAALWREDGSSLPSEVTLDASDARRLKMRVLEPAAGSYQLHWHAVSAGARLGTDGAQPLTLRNESPAPPRLDVSPSTTDTGERLELVGKGFEKPRPMRRAP